MSIFEVMPKDVVFEIFTLLPATDVSTLVSTCSAAAAAFTTDKFWYFDWVERTRGYGSALVAAIKRSDVESLRRLLSRAPKGFDINSVVDEETGFRVLHHAIVQGHILTLHELLSVPGIDARRCTALHLAVVHDRALSVGMLLECRDVDPNERDPYGLTPLHVACTFGRTTMVMMLVQHPRVDVNARNTEENTPLHDALHYGAPVAALGALLQHPRVDVNAVGAGGRTALHMAVDYAVVEEVQVLLVEPRVDVNAQDPDGRTALHVAASSSSEAVVRALLGAPGVDVNARCAFGMTPLHYTAISGNVPAAIELSRAPGVDTTAVCASGQTAAEMAAAHDLTL
jgi:ankyrin repeat protein